MTDHDRNDDDVESWLDSLSGRADGETDPEATRIRELVLRRQRRFDDEIDEVRLARGRRRLLQSMAAAGSSVRKSPPRYLGIAASVAIVLAVSSVLVLNDSGDLDGDGTIKSVDPGLVPDGWITISVDSDAPSATADELASRLRDAQLAFETVADPDGSFELTIVTEGAGDVQALSQALNGISDAEIIFSGAYRIRIQ